MTEKRFQSNGSMIFDDRKALNTIDVVELLNMLHEENRQLKQRNNNQYNQLKQLWELIEDEDYNTLRSMLNQRETDEKLLQKEWGTYSD